MYEPDTIRKRARLFAKHVTLNTRVAGPSDSNYKCNCCGRYLSRWYNGETVTSYVYYWETYLEVVGRWSAQRFSASVACVDCHQKIVEALQKIAYKESRSHALKMKEEMKKFKRHLGIIRRMSR